MVQENLPQRRELSPSLGAGLAAMNMVCTLSNGVLVSVG